MAEEFDLVVIGGGPGGYAAALYAAGAGFQTPAVSMLSTCPTRSRMPASCSREILPV